MIDSFFLGNFNISAIAPIVDKACYLLLALDFLWGMYCIVTAYARLNRFGFRNREQQNEFIDEVVARLRNRQFDEAAEMCEGDVRILPAPDQDELALHLCRAIERVGVLTFAESAAVQVRRVEAAGGGDVGSQTGAKGEMAADAEADHTDASAALRV